MITTEVIREIAKYLRDTCAVPPWKCSECGKECYKFKGSEGPWLHIVKSHGDTLYDCQGRAYNQDFKREQNDKRAAG